MKYSIGVDLGGTNIRLAVVSEKGEIVAVNKQWTKTQNGKITKWQNCSFTNTR